MSRTFKKFRWAIFGIGISLVMMQNFYTQHKEGSDREIKLERHSNDTELLKREYLLPPDGRSYNLSSKPVDYKLDPLFYGKATRTYIQLLFSIVYPHVGGFFIEAGALDGEYLSNTLYLEYFQNWTGLLIEPEPANFRSLVEKHRNAWLSNTCISTTPYTKNISFISISPTNNQTESLKLRGQSHDLRFSLLSQEDASSYSQKNVTALCFPLDTYLMALDVTTVDLFSLDIQGGEFEVLKTVSWDKVHFRVIVVEDIDEYLNEELITFMESKGFVFIDYIMEDYIFYNKNDSKIESLVKLINIDYKDGMHFFSIAID